MTKSTPGLPLAATTAVSTFAWYALPDVVRSPFARTLLKGALLGGGAAAWVALRDDSRCDANGPDAIDDALYAMNKATPAQVGIAAAAAAGALAVTAWGERAIFRLGERRRADGVRGAHTRPALLWAALAGAGALIPDPDPAA